MNSEEMRKKLVAAQTHKIMMLSAERDQALLEREEALVERDMARQGTKGIIGIMRKFDAERDQLRCELHAARLHIKELEAQVRKYEARAAVRR